MLHRPLSRAAALAAILIASACTDPSHALNSPTGPSAELRKFTGTAAKIVWVHSNGGDASPTATDLVLMGLSSEDDKGARVILGARQSYVKPLLTPRGDRVVFSRLTPINNPEVFIVGWDGAGLKPLAKGFALAVWENPADRSEWLYVGTNNNEFDFATVSRFPIDDPSKSELVWNQTPVSSDTFQVSADGRFAAGLFPWPNAGIAELPNRSWKKLGDGCWTGMATPRGPISWYFDGAHRNLTMVDSRADKKWVVPINGAPGFQNSEVYHPRWTSHPRFMAMTGPYNQGGANQVRSGGAQTEVWLGRFSEDFSRIEAWLRATTNSGADSYPDMWLDIDRSPFPRRPAGAIGPAAAQTSTMSRSPAPTAARVVLEARLARVGQIPSPRSILPYRHALVVNEYDVVRIMDGQYVHKTIQVAQWAIRDGRVLADARRTAGAATRLVVERFDAHPELEGERLLTDLGASDLPLYYEIKP